MLTSKSHGCSCDSVGALVRSAVLPPRVSLVFTTYAAACDHGMLECLAALWTLPPLPGRDNDSRLPQRPAEQAADVIGPWQPQPGFFQLPSGQRLGLSSCSGKGVRRPRVQ